MADLQYAGEFDLEKCELISSAGVIVDISAIIVEINIFEGLKEKNSDPETVKKLNATITKLAKIKFTGSWEWDDVAFWDKVYEENWFKLKSGDSSFFEKKFLSGNLYKYF